MVVEFPLSGRAVLSKPGLTIVAETIAPVPMSVGGLLPELMTVKFCPNSEVLFDGSVAVAVIRSPAASPLTVRFPLKLPLASAVRKPR